MKLSIIPSEQYPRHELEIPSWHAEKCGIPKAKSEVSIVRQTENGYVIRLEKSNKEVLVSKVLCEIVERKEVSLGNF